MPLNESRLSDKIVSVIDLIKVEEVNSETAKQQFADALAKAIVEELKLANVTGICPSTGGALVNGKIT